MLGEREARFQREKGWLTSEDTVEAAAYDQEDGRRVIYAINTDWYSQKETAQGVLCAGGVEYPVDPPGADPPLRYLRRRGGGVVRLG